MSKANGHPTPPMVLDFIRLYAETGNHTEAIKRAGYKSKNPDAMGRTYKVRYRKEIDAAVSARISELEPTALSAIAELAKGADSEQVKLKANQDLLDRGKHLRGERTEQAEPEQTTADLIAEMVRMTGHEATALALRKLGIPVPDYISEQLEQAGGRDQDTDHERGLPDTEAGQPETPQQVN